MIGQKSYKMGLIITIIIILAVVVLVGPEVFATYKGVMACVDGLDCSGISIVAP